MVKWIQIMMVNKYLIIKITNRKKSDIYCIVDGLPEYIKNSIEIWLCTTRGPWIDSGISIGELKYDTISSIVSVSAITKSTIRSRSATII